MVVLGNIEVYRKSVCCNADVKIIGRNNPHYECMKCRKICSVRAFNIDSGRVAR